MEDISNAARRNKRLNSGKNLSASDRILLIHYFGNICRADKEKSKFQQEVYELLAQLDNVTKEKLMSIKTVEKLEVHVAELNVKIEELNRTVIDITNHKTRISQENIELTKEVQDLKVNNFKLIEIHIWYKCISLASTKRKEVFRTSGKWSLRFKIICGTIDNAISVVSLAPFYYAFLMIW